MGQREKSNCKAVKPEALSFPLGALQQAWPPELSQIRAGTDFCISMLTGGHNLGCGGSLQDEANLPRGFNHQHHTVHRRMSASVLKQVAGESGQRTTMHDSNFFSVSRC